MIDFGYSGEDWRNAAESTGTTIMAAEYDGGVIFGADSRTSTGTYVADRVSNKITRVTDKIFCCRSGSAADTQAIAEMVKYSMNFHENQTGEESLVEDAASEFRTFCYDYRGSLLAGIIVGGWDKKLGGQVYCVPLGGMLVRQKYTIGGSGSSYVYAFVKENYRENMSKEECIDFVRKTILHAMHFDGSSGGVARIACVNKDGINTDIHYAPITPTGNEISAIPTVVGV